jgi:hypothetical protein
MGGGEVEIGRRGGRSFFENAESQHERVLVKGRRGL